MSDTFVVSNEAQLNAALTVIDLTGSLSAVNATYTISFSNSFTLASELYAVNLASGDTLTIQGDGYTLDGGGSQRGFFVYAGTVDISALAIDDAVATGGAGGNGDFSGGGGAGLGGGLFIAAAGAVTLSGVSFDDDSAVGGAGGSGSFCSFGGGGGIGQSAVGGNGGSGGAGIVIGAEPGGSGSFFEDGPNVPTPNPAAFAGGGGGGGGGGGFLDYDSIDIPGGGGIGGSNGPDEPIGGAGGFGGGGGIGAAGGFGGGGGGGFGGSSGEGGNGGFGGGGGGAGGRGGFGGGNSSGDAGGGGLGAGGAVFVQQGGVLIYGAGAESGGSVAGGAGGRPGSAFGSGIFLQGNEQVTLDPAAGQTLTFDGVIADQTGSGGTGSNAGAGSLLIDGAGTVVLAADNTFSGGITLVSGELDLAAPGAAGSGPIVAKSGGGARLVIGATDFTFHVGSEADLNNVLQLIDLTGAASAPDADYAISFKNSFTLTSELYAVNLAAGDMLTIQGNGYTLNGGGTQRGLFVYAGTVDINALAIADTVATGGAGGAGGSAGGGGAGLGGGLFIAAAGTVTLSGVSFDIDSAVGGAGGSFLGQNYAPGGGGGLGGAGGAGGLGGAIGGGGGIGQSAVGGTGLAGGTGIVIGAAAGGSGAGLPAAPGGSDGGGGGGGLIQYDYAGNAAGGGVGGGNAPDAPIGGAGGFGGGGAGPRGHGGFGGGGGGGGDGGFGGGGGASGQGGFGAGNGPEYVGGGGLGAGGAIFVQYGGVLSYGEGMESGASVTGGAGGEPGSAYGNGIFLQGNEQITLDPAAGQTLIIEDVIADQTGSGGTGGNAGAGSLMVDGPGKVVLTADNTFTGGITIAGGTLDLSGPGGAAGSGPITFAADVDPVMVFDLADVPTNPIEGFGPGDTIEITGFVPFGSIYVDGTLDVAGLTPSHSAAVAGLDLPGLDLAAFSVTTDGANTFVTALCFAAGTRIATPAGDRRVETLRPGDAVLAAGPDGDWQPQTVRWVGIRTLDLSTHPDPELAAPIRIRADALAPGLPVRDLVLSPDHCLLLDGHLLRAFRLLNGVSVVQERPARVTYVHVELDGHALLLAEGMAAESYLEEGHRGFFVGATARPGPLADRAVPACAPYAPDDAFAERIWCQVAARAKAPAPRRPPQGRALPPRWMFWPASDGCARSRCRAIASCMRCRPAPPKSGLCRRPSGPPIAGPGPRTAAGSVRASPT